MIVYIESNFILELVKMQTHADQVDQIIQLAEARKIALAFPSFALCEPFWTMTQRERDQQRLSKSLEGMIEQLPALLAQATKEGKDRLWATITRIVENGRSIETDSACLKRAKECQERFGLSQQDSIIYSAVIGDLQRQPLKESKFFMSKNVEDFGDPGIRSELATYKCVYEGNFHKGLNAIAFELRRTNL